MSASSIDRPDLHEQARTVRVADEARRDDAGRVRRIRGPGTPRRPWRPAASGRTICRAPAGSRRSPRWCPPRRPRPGQRRPSHPRTPRSRRGRAPAPRFATRTASTARRGFTPLSSTISGTARTSRRTSRKLGTPTASGFQGSASAGTKRQPASMAASSSAVCADTEPVAPVVRRQDPRHE